MEINSGKANLYIQATEAVSESGSTDSIQASAPEILASANQGSDTLEQVHKQSLDEMVGLKSDVAAETLTAQSAGQVRDNNMPNAPWGVDRNAWNIVNQKHHIPKTLFTGSGDDQVDVTQKEDGLVHVNVNGKEAWSGTLEEFQYLTIDTGDGNDFVKNMVSGASIMTGKGEDTVWNRASNTTINTGEGNDQVYNENLVYDRNFYFGFYNDTRIGNNNTIDTGEGNDQVYNEGKQNIIRTGSGNDNVSEGVGAGDNNINTGEGEDVVELGGVFGQGKSDHVEDPDNDPLPPKPDPAKFWG